VPVFGQRPALSIDLSGSRPALKVVGATNCRYAVEWVAELPSAPPWQSLCDFVLATNPCAMIDTSAPSARFYRVKLKNPSLTVTDAQVQDLCSRLSDYLAVTNKIPEALVVGGSNTNVVTVADLYALMVKWLAAYRVGNVPPATVSIAQGNRGPAAPTGIETGTIYLADILTASVQDGGYLDAHGALPNCSTAAALQYSTKAMLWLYARTINWYQDHTATMPVYASVRAVAGPDSWTAPPPPTGIRVAVFTDPDGGSTTVSCVTSTVNILSTNGGFVVSTVTGAQIRSGALDNYDVVMFPGGSGTGEANALQQSGCAKVEQFVARGGGYVGTCAGAYLPALGYNTATTWLQIVDAQIIDVDHWDRGSGVVQVHSLNTNNVILAGFGEHFNAQYFSGPLLAPGGAASLPDYEAQAVFVTDIHDNGPAGVMPGKACMTTSVYQSGRCVLFSFHPELTPGLEQMDVRAVKWAAGKL
jgi:glutamine amidotransferase PdxT